MAIKPFNSVGGYSVGPNLTPFLDANNDANVANLTVNGSFDLPSGTVTIDNLIVTGDTQVETLAANGAVVFDTTANVGGVLTVTGNVDADANLNVATNAIIGGYANVTGVLTVTANIDGGANLNLAGSADITGQLIVDGAATLNGATTIDDTLTVTGAANIDSTLRVGNTLDVVSNASVGGTFDVTGLTTLVDANIDGNLVLTGSGTFGGLNTFTGEFIAQDQSTFNGNVLFNGDEIVIDGTSLTSNGTVSFTGSNVALGQAANLHILGGSNGQYLRTLDSVTGAVEWATVDTDTLANGTSNVDIPVADGPVRVGVGGTANVAVFTTTGLDVTSNITATSTVTAATLYANTLANVLDLTVRGNANVAGTSNVVGAADFGSTVTVTGATTLNGTANINNTLGVTGAATFDSTVDVGLKLTVTDDAEVTGLLEVGGNIDGAVNLNLIGDANIRDLGARGNANVAGTANVVGAANLGSTLGVVGAATFDSTVLVSGAANINNTLIVTGAANLSSTLGVAGIATFDNDVTIGTGTTLTFDDATGATGEFTTSLNTAIFTANGLVTLGAIGNVKITGGTEGQVLTAGATAGDLVWSSSPNVTQIVNGTSNVKIATADGNVTVGVNGQSNIITVQSNGTFATTTFVDDVLVTGNLTVQGNVTNIDSTTLNVEDPVITEGRGPNNAPLTTNDGLDRGLYSWYYEGGAEKGGFVGYKNAGAFAGSYVIAKNATIADNTVTVSTYANVVVAGIVSGPAGNVTGNPVSSIDMGTGSAIAFRVDSEAAVLNVTAADITANANVAVNGNVGVTGGNITVTGGTAGAFGSQIVLAAAASSGPAIATTIGSGAVVTQSSTPTPIVTIADAVGRTVEFFVSSRDTTNGNFEGTKYLVVSNGLTGVASVVESTAYGTVRIGAQTQQVEVTFTADGTDLVARVAVLNNTDTTQFSTQYQIVG